jgi:hypothetical protein
MMSKSPKVAVSLLNYLDDSPYFESMIGDLDEFCVEGRSQAWYWRQTLIAVTRQFLRDVWSNRFAALQVLIVVWACMPLYNLVRLFALKILVMAPLDLWRSLGLTLFATSFDQVPRSLAQGLRSDGTPYLFPACAILILMAWTFGVGTGWLVTRLHPQHHHRTMVILYTASMLATVLPNVGSLAVAAYANQTFGPVFHLLLYSANNTALIAGILVEGLLRRRPDPQLGRTFHLG